MALYALDGIEPELPASGRVFVADSAEVVGRVRLGEDVGIWFGCVLRGDTELIDIQAGSNIQDSSVLHTDTGFPLVVGPGVTVGHAAILHGCTIGADSLIGMGATVLTGAKIGTGSLVGAGSLVTERKEFPDFSLIVGSPARVVRTLRAEEIAALRHSAAHYMENARRFAKGLKRVDRE
ncbi:MAG TPA: gamma carbonic anhydrase family protein [Hyphomicrobiales bacterium]|nr:gamma carbonic anhydrase family protein [Hyphomicrobiales bacterium]